MPKLKKACPNCGSDDYSEEKADFILMCAGDSGIDLTKPVNSIHCTAAICRDCGLVQLFEKRITRDGAQ
jgi:predicted nucleic-acid-binding Zn-ribbon protein